MRSFVLFAFVLAALPRHACERNNPDHCQFDTDCGQDQICADGACTVRQCSNNEQCNADHPVCTNKRCSACASDTECRGRIGGRGLPVPACQAGSCVECNPANACTDAARATCDLDRFQCRGCEFHRECASGVCAKDDLLAGLAAPNNIPKGVCVPPERVISVNKDLLDCDAPGKPRCAVASALSLVSEERPYVRVINAGARIMPLTLPPAPNALKVLHLIGPAADTPPTKLTGRPPLIGATGTMAAVTVSPGYSAVLEGFLIAESATGIRCAGIAAGRAEVHLLRSVVTKTDVGISASNCAVVVDSSWLGKPAMLPLVGLGTNLRAMDLVDSDLVLENSVLWQNGILGMDAFGGIMLSDTPGRSSFVSRIVNSTLVGHDASQMGGPAALDCKIDMSGRLTLLNSYLLNDGLGAGRPSAQVNPLCKAQATGVVSNDPGLSNGGLLVMDPADFVDYVGGDFHLKPAARARATGSGSLLLPDLRGNAVEVVPYRDIEDAVRGRVTPGQVSSGAFEAPKS